MSPDFRTNLQEYAALKASDVVNPAVKHEMSQLEDWLGDHAKGMQKNLMKAAIKAAAVQTGVTIVLNFIPVVGQAIAALYGAFTTWSNNKYQKRCEGYVKQQQDAMKAYTDMWQRKLDEALAAAYKRAYKGAVELALSNQPLTPTVTKDADFINPGMYHDKMDGLGAGGALTGENIWTKCKRETDAMVLRVKNAFLAYAPPQIARVKERGFTDALRLAIAMEIRKNPNMLLYYKLFGAGTPLDYLDDVVRAEEHYKQEALKKSGAFDAAPAAAPKSGVSTGAKVALAAAAVGGAVLLLKGN